MYNTAGVYHHYDSMVFPRDALITRGLSERVISGMRSVRNLLPWGKKNETSSKDNLEVPEYHTILQNCLMFYIDSSYKGIISTGQFSDSLPLAKVVQGIYHIYTCLLESHFTYDDGPQIISFKPCLKNQLLQEVFLYTDC